jgi:hypothetical protein
MNTTKVKDKVDAVADTVKAGVDKAGTAVHDAAKIVADKVVEVGGKMQDAVKKT